MLERPQLVGMRSIIDDRGELIATDVPFSARRAFMLVSGSFAVERGGHAHIALHQMFIRVAGAIEVRVESVTGVSAVVLLEGDAFYVPPRIWVDVMLGPNSTLLVLASAPYDESDYVRDHKTFRDLAP